MMKNKDFPKKHIFTHKNNPRQKDIQNKTQVEEKSEPEAEFEDFFLEDSSMPENAAKGFDFSRKTFQKPIHENKFTNFFDEDDDDDGFEDIEKSYQKFLSSRKNADARREKRAVKPKEYNLQDFLEDFCEEKKDISELLDKMPVELKDQLLKTLLSRKKI